VADVADGKQLIETSRIRVAYRTWGSPGDPALVLLHATGETSDDWVRVGETLGEQRNVVAPDLRGHGDSDWSGGYSVEAMRDDLVAFLDALGLQEVDLVGHSLGGIVAYLVAAAQPDRVARLVLEDVTAPLPRAVVRPIRPDGDLPFDWEMVLAVRGQIDDPPAPWMSGLEHITARTLVIGGGEASPMPQDRVAELADRIPQARVVTIEAGHFVHTEAPEAFVRVVAAFLDEVAPPLVCSVVIAQPSDDAFATYTQRFGDWWDPRLTPDPDTYCGAVIEPRVGGAVSLLHGDDSYRFGEVLTWQPGQHFAQTFTLALDPTFPTTITVDFVRIEDGTRVTLTHGGWVEGNVGDRRKFGDWQRLLDRYAALA
jgi:3-oxoadipate enol-lactonase